MPVERMRSGIGMTNGLVFLNEAHLLDLYNWIYVICPGAHDVIYQFDDKH